MSLNLTLSVEERNNLLQCINIAVKASENAVSTAMVLAPVASRLSQLVDVPDPVSSIPEPISPVAEFLLQSPSEVAKV